MRKAPSNTIEPDWHECAFVTIARCAGILAVSKASVYNLEKSGRLEFRQLAGRAPVTVSSVLEAVEGADPWTAAPRRGTAALKTEGSAE